MQENPALYTSVGYLASSGWLYYSQLFNDPFLSNHLCISAGNTTSLHLAMLLAFKLYFAVCCIVD